MNTAAEPVDVSAHELARLRDRARDVLGHFSTTASSGVDAAAALAVLHELAATPGSARDALAVLQELQVHQVELQLQAEDLRQARLDLEARVDALQAFHEQWPVACLSLDEHGRILQANHLARTWLGDPQADTQRRTLRSFLLPGSAVVLSSLLAAVRAGRSIGARALELKVSAGLPNAVWATASVESESEVHSGPGPDSEPPGSRRVLLVLMRALQTPA